MLLILKKYWFMIGLMATSLATIADGSGLLVIPGIWFGAHHGPDAVIVVIFFLSGIALDTRQIRAGMTDYSGTLLALVLIFAAAPLLAIGFSQLPLATSITLGLYLVAVMPSTLSSGVVMTGSAGGNMAHALLITILANSLAMFTIPPTLDILLGAGGNVRLIAFDGVAIMTKIAVHVLLPLAAGILVRHRFNAQVIPLLRAAGTICQTAILIIVWMALCTGRTAIVAGFDTLFHIVVTVSAFHLILVLVALAATGLAGIKKGRRESIIFMGGQKTLPLSVILQVSLFPEHGIILVVCVIHHIVHLIMDAFLIRYLLEKSE